MTSDAAGAESADGEVPGAGSVDPKDHPPRAFPDADWAWFLARCAALGIDGADGRRPVLEALYGHLVGVNAWLNLTRLTAPRDYLKQHVLDSLSVVGDTRLRHLADGAPCVDLGSGGGYPGLPLALWHPTIPWVLADARRRKAEFLAAAAGLSGAKVSARHLRGGESARAAPDLFKRCQLVVSRAMGQADAVLAEAGPLLRLSGHVLIFKGPAFAGDERTAALGAAKRLGFRYLSERRVVLEDGDPERVVVVFQRTGA
jgi:16S rRNA (guanine527-N7)-methyltransferase